MCSRGNGRRYDPSIGRVGRMVTAASTSRCGTGESYKHNTPIDMLPNDVLLEIFSFCRETLRHSDLPGWKWDLLAHVCQRWRQVVFTSPHCLNLQILCTNKTAVKKNLAIWPAFPIVINYRYSGRSIRSGGKGNIIAAALRHPDRVCHINIDIKRSQLGKVATMMQEPFPVLKYLRICTRDGSVPALPVKFLGGSAPRLQEIILSRIPFPALPTLLLFTSDLVTLELYNIPPEWSHFTRGDGCGFGRFTQAHIS